jgi:hypothetical protein
LALYFIYHGLLTLDLYSNASTLAHEVEQRTHLLKIFWHNNHPAASPQSYRGGLVQDQSLGLQTLAAQNYFQSLTSLSFPDAKQFFRDPLKLFSDVLLVWL